MEQYSMAAFPLKEALTQDNEGMTLLDYFAAKAMQGIVSSAGDAISQDLGPNVRGHSEYSINECAALSYTIASAMLEARKIYIK